ncbi:Major facilitator superfamily domain general substrate transporter [Penicillium longicatenatum]|nr:Major facilitator superfamily domain general substrate transporter [Penicillium longicatenatum]
MRDKSISTFVEPNVTPFTVAVAGFANMLCIGTVYALSTLQAQLPRLFDIPDAWSFAPFFTACLGLSVGVLTSASMIIQSGAHTTVARGTTLWGIAVVSAGLCLSSLRLGLFFTCFLFGGLGIGWTYLGVVALINQGLPDHALARSAIGPLGFSTAAATCFLLSSTFRLDAVDAETLGRMLVLLGVTFAAVGVSTQLTLPDFSKDSPVSSSKISLSSASGNLFSILLFFNALPGMTVFTGLLPIASHYTNGTEYSKIWILSPCMIALALGGILAPRISAYCGAKLTFVVILCLRGVLLVLLSQSEGSTQAICAMLAILFAHGAGFSILPGLIKAQSSNQRHFYLNYGRVLVSWGISGVIGCIVNSIILSPFSAIPTASLVIGLSTFSFGVILHFVPKLGNELLAR